MRLLNLIKSFTSNIYNIRIDSCNTRISGFASCINFGDFMLSPSESDKSFNKEMNTLAKLRNRNLVKVLGYAWESGKLKPLFLEYMENGNLDRVIHDSGIDRSRWDLSQRVDVIVSVSRGAISAEISYTTLIIKQFEHL
ncbi:hypothetical protein L1987_53071 [Smallanthus sonchifolius]|uniref:Uncharacterized protein n=1 Tax=Smallanthus sonchifolius TaxID=185202 RepID=A0ACB9EVN8_9ASTR|nr:hypothetical protein L1987_53071 [Smallanthus sonchifolius]